MGRIAALYRFPVKGFTPGVCETLTISDDGRVAGDRVLGVRFADTAVSDDAWSRKTAMVALENTPGLARLEVRFDAETDRLCVSLGGDPVVDDLLDSEGRKGIAAAVERYVIAQEINPLRDHPERLPLRMVGDGITPRYHDSEFGQVTLHGRETLAAVEAALNGAEVSELRFRSNVAVEGVDPWEEQEWIGQTIRVGSVRFNVVRAKFRCLATHANPKSGERDLPILNTLIRLLPRERPTFAVAMVPTGKGGEVRVGDQVVVV